MDKPKAFASALSTHEDWRAAAKAAAAEVQKALGGPCDLALVFASARYEGLEPEALSPQGDDIGPLAAGLHQALPHAAHERIKCLLGHSFCVRVGPDVRDEVLAGYDVARPLVQVGQQPELLIRERRPGLDALHVHAARVGIDMQRCRLSCQRRNTRVDLHSRLDCRRRC